MSDEIQRPKIGTGVVVIKDKKILLGKRKGSHGSGEYGLPGGHLEYLEGFEECIKRETLEETGICIKNVKFISVHNSVKYRPKHYVNINFVADWESGEPRVLEPEKCEGWDWYDLDKLPSPIFGMSLITIKSYQENKNYYDKE